MPTDVRRRRLAMICSGVALCAVLPAAGARADDFRAGFDDETVSWTVHYDESKVRQLAHRRNRFLFVGGKASENFEFDAQSEGQFIQMEHPLPAARVFDELKLSLWVRSNRPGAVLFLRVIFPRQVDPSTGKVLKTYVRGDRYTDAGKWQKLRCTTRESQIKQQVRILRAKFPETSIDTGEAFVDRAFLTTRLIPGATEFFLDELALGPVVPVREEDEIRQAGDENDVRPPVAFPLKRWLQVEGVPFFPRMVPYQGERPQGLRNTRLNVVWIPKAGDEPLAESLHRADLWLAATPPRATTVDGRVLDPRDASILPFTDRTRSILFWNMGMRVPADAKAELVGWKRQVQDAEADFDRPIMADVSGQERVYSRHVGMLGVGRQVIGTTLTLKQYRDWLIQRRKLARPGSFVWTWIQVEPQFLDGRPVDGSAVIEPEQIRLQVYAALSAGVRGLGYFTTGPLDAQQPAARERRLALTQINLELELLEPWLATGTLTGHVPFQVTQPTMRIGQRSLDFRRSEGGARQRRALLKERDNQARRNRQLAGELEAAIIRSNYGTLLLPVWYHSDAHFVPPQMAANDATIIVRGVSESAAAWEISTTGIPRILESERVTGGIKITLPKFDQTAAVVLTSDHSLMEKVRAKVGRIARLSARTAIDLTRAKFERVRSVDAELESLGAGQVDSHRLLSQASEKLAGAEQAYRRKDFSLVAELASQARQLLRILQSAHWYDATRPLASPVASPYAVSFQTLPKHWRLIRQIGRSPMKYDADLLPSADFEDAEAIVAEGWRHEQNATPNVQATAELYPTSRTGDYALRLVAAADVGSEPPKVLEEAPVTVTTPPLPVREGQIVHVSGRVRVVTPVSASLDGAMIYDTQTGPAGAVRWTKPSGWHRFEMIRTVRSADDFRLTMALTGLGEIQFDDIQVVPHTPGINLAAASEPQPEERPGLGTRALQLLERIPRLKSPIPQLPDSLPRFTPPTPEWPSRLPSWDSPWSDAPSSSSNAANATR